MGNPQRPPVGTSNRTPIASYGSSSGGFGNNAAYPPSNRSTRGGRR